MEEIFGLISSLFFTGAIFYWAIRAIFGKDLKAKEQILKPFPYIFFGSVISLVIKNSISSSHGNIVSFATIFIAFFLTSFFTYSLTIEHLGQEMPDKKEENHLKGLIVAFITMLLILLLMASYS